MAGQSLGYAGLRDTLPFHGRADVNSCKTPACSVVPVLFASDRHRRPRHVCAAISGSIPPKTTVLQQQTSPIYESDEIALIDTVPEQPDDADASEDNVICTFRWPAALPGQDVSVVGAALPSLQILHLSAAGSRPPIHHVACPGPGDEVSLFCRILHRLAESHCSKKELTKQRLHSYGCPTTRDLSGIHVALCSRLTARMACSVAGTACS